jgi:hypothetical protein
MNGERGRAESPVNESRSARAFMTHRFLLRVAFAGAHVFAWIFAYHFFYILTSSGTQALARTAFLYALSHTVACLLTPLTARFLRHGIKYALMYALFSAIAALTILGAAFQGYFGGSLSVVLGVVVFSILIGVYRAFYYVPYGVEAHTQERRPSVMTEIFVALVPAGVGLYIASTALAPVWILLAAAVLVFLSIVPLVNLRDHYERFSWGYRETFAHLNARENRPLLHRSIVEGVTGAALLLAWPIAIFGIVGWSYGMFGTILSVTFLVALFMRAPVRSALRRAQLHRSQWLNTLFVATPWLLRLAVATPLGIVFVDSYFYTMTPARHGVDPFVFEQVADGGSYIDEYTALKEMGHSVGRILLALTLGVLALLISVPAAFVGAFVLAALASTASLYGSER